MDRAHTDKYGVPHPKIEYKVGENERKMARHMDATFEAILDCREGRNGAVQTRADRCTGTAIHEHGTCRMGADPKRSALNKYNQFHEVKNLFVADGSSFTTRSRRTRH